MKEWLDFIEDEYLTTFLRTGGGAVKFAIANSEKRAALRETLKVRSEKKDYVFVALDPSELRVHMPQDIFFGMASQIDWRQLTRRLILRFLARKNYNVQNIDPTDTKNILDAVSELNEIDSEYIFKADLRPLLVDEVFRNPNISKAFRVAMMHLCNLEIQARQQDKFPAQPILEWLTGRNTRISAVRDFQIYTPINRTTARYFIESTLTWIRFAGYSGTVLFLDNARILLNRNPRDGKRFYTRAAVIDHYEILREFIDGIDQLEGALILVATDNDFVDDDCRRGWRVYNALHARIIDDVRDRNVVNPAAVLVRIA